jgi:hypothetical protein
MRRRASKRSSAREQQSEAAAFRRKDAYVPWQLGRRLVIQRGVRESEPLTPGAQRLESKICEGGFGSHRFLRPITGSAKNNPVKVCGPCREEDAAGRDSSRG